MSFFLEASMMGMFMLELTWLMIISIAYVRAPTYTFDSLGILKITALATKYS